MVSYLGAIAITFNFYFKAILFQMFAHYKVSYILFEKFLFIQLLKESKTSKTILTFPFLQTS